MDKHRVSSTGRFSSIGKAKFTSNDSCRDTTADTSPVRTAPSFSYNRSAQLKHTFNDVLTRVHTHTRTQTVAC
ncbi:unnamed protein product [Hymenolepis diminuta]|uniref:Uncharacterized protein n=1 Tax=Hymenolepis diminuta TaxID=6216 RepID=A0A564XX62_HYMDI|nr:unnamed protein product [Hymenolepis diminuta]